MFVSACPIVGRLCAYPSQSQERLRTAVRNGETVVELGPSCFNASVHLDPRGRHYQTTPARGQKTGGHRTVCLLAEGATSAAVYKTGGRWGLHSDGSHTSTLVQPSPEVPTEIQWEWSLEVNLGHAREADWLPYADDACAELESAWTRVQSGESDHESVSIATGQSTKNVLIAPGSVFFEQHDAYTNNRRWVRRSCRTLTECRLKRAAMQSRVQTFAEDSCAICTESFTDTPLWPVVKTPCGHPYHACCLQECKARRGDARCPLCRADL